MCFCSCSIIDLKFAILSLCFVQQEYCCPGYFGIDCNGVFSLTVIVLRVCNLTNDRPYKIFITVAAFITVSVKQRSGVCLCVCLLRLDISLNSSTQGSQHTFLPFSPRTATLVIECLCCLKTNGLEFSTISLLLLIPK